MQALRQDLRLRQELTLQPQQILRSELIQMPILELEMRVMAELEQNPFLEEIEPSEDRSEPERDEAREETLAEDDHKIEDKQSTDEKLDKAREVNWEDILNDTDHWEYRSRKRVPIDGTMELPQPYIPSLAEHLNEQLRLDDFNETEMSIGEEIIGNIDRNGYLSCSLDEIADSLDETPEMVARVHSEIMEFDPLGIGARDLRECLLVQLRHRQPAAPIPYRIIDEYWKDFINKRFEVLAEKLNVVIEDIKEAFEIIAKLNPKPGEGYFEEKQNYVIPDLIVAKVGGEFVVLLNDGDIPNFRINNAYRELYMNRRGADKNVREFLSRKLESARWFINAIHQRRTTMVRTMHAIINRQIGFFEHGLSRLKPMILADIAYDISMDISTISRVTSRKYVQTDWGVFELKYFFSERMETEDGEEVSNRVIKARLKELIGNEDKHKPYSDQQLTDLLNEEGFHIRRRTVAKYREQFQIPIKRLRREI